MFSQPLSQVLARYVSFYFGIRFAVLASKKEIMGLGSWMSTQLVSSKDAFYEVSVFSFLKSLPIKIPKTKKQVNVCCGVNKSFCEILFAKTNFRICICKCHLVVFYNCNFMLWFMCMPPGIYQVSEGCSGPLS